jgi:hypothetical protein
MKVEITREMVIQALGAQSNLRQEQELQQQLNAVIRYKKKVEGALEEVFGDEISIEHVISNPKEVYSLLINCEPEVDIMADILIIIEFITHVILKRVIRIYY